MSRCLPYTPSVKAVNDREALLEPIKLPRELEKKSKTDRKKEKKERKVKKLLEENRKGHKEDELSTCATIRGVDAIASYPQEVEFYQLEKSDITEEHELPTLSDNMSYLSDGTQGGAKRKRTIIRFKSLSKHSDVSADASCSDPTSGKADFETGLKMTEIVHAPSALTNNVEFEKATSTSNQKVLTREDHAEDSLHQSLIVDWVQPLLESVLEDYGDQDWLFETKQENSHGSKRFKASNEVVSGCTLWPQAHWLPEPGLSALPFTVPF